MNTSDSEDAVLGGILRRWITDGIYRYWSLNDYGTDYCTLTLDAKIELTTEEADAIDRIVDA